MFNDLSLKIYFYYNFSEDKKQLTCNQALRFLHDRSFAPEMAHPVSKHDP